MYQLLARLAALLSYRPAAGRCARHRSASHRATSEARREEARRQRARRRTLWLAVHGVDVGPRVIHGVEVAA